MRSCFSEYRWINQRGNSGEKFGGVLVQSMRKDALIIADKQKSVAIIDGQIDGNIALYPNNLLPKRIFNFFDIVHILMKKRKRLASILILFSPAVF